MIWALIAGASCAFLQAGPAAAQSNDSTRGYDGQALRYESYWGNARIIRGADGPVVGTAGWFRSFDVEKLVGSSPSALIEARRYNTNNFRGSVIGSIGAATTLIGMLVTANGSNNASSPMLIVAGVGTMAWSAQHFRIAYSALSRSLWWYNRDVASTAATRSPPATKTVPPPNSDQSKRDHDAK